MKLLTAIAVLFTLVVPAAEAAPVRCTTGGVCPKLDFKPNHICYLPDAGFAPEDVCELPIGVVNGRLNPSPPVPAPWPITFTYSAFPAHVPLPGSGSVPRNHATIAAGATGGVVPVPFLLPGERALVYVSHGNDPVLAAEVLFRG